MGYDSCTGSGSHGPYAGFFEVVPPGHSDFRLQNGTSPYCLYSNPGPGTNGIGPGRFAWVPDEWMTFKIRIKAGPRNLTTNEWDNSEFKLWGAREGQASQLLVWWRPGIPDYFPLTAGPPSENQRFGKLFLLPYMTSKDKTQDHAVAQTWYDDVIISTQDIADPSGAANANASPNAKLALAANTAINLGPYNPKPPQGDTTPNSPHATDYSGMQYDANRRQMVLFGGGHAGNELGHDRSLQSRLARLDPGVRADAEIGMGHVELRLRPRRLEIGPGRTVSASRGAAHAR